MTIPHPSAGLCGAADPSSILHDTRLQMASKANVGFCTFLHVRVTFVILSSYLRHTFVIHMRKPLVLCSEMELTQMCYQDVVRC